MQRRDREMPGRDWQMGAGCSAKIIRRLNHTVFKKTFDLCRDAFSGGGTLLGIDRACVAEGLQLAETDFRDFELVGGTPLLDFHRRSLSLKSEVVIALPYYKPKTEGVSKMGEK